MTNYITQTSLEFRILCLGNVGEVLVVWLYFVITLSSLIIVADISDVFVYIGETIRESNFDSFYSLCGNHLGSVEDSGTLVIRCTEPTYGQYVTILLNGDEKEIAICEVYVFAHQGNVSWNSKIPCNGFIPQGSMSLPGLLFTKICDSISRKIAKVQLQLFCVNLIRSLCQISPCTVKIVLLVPPNSINSSRPSYACVRQ